jgi:hypothetical protein
MRGNKGMRERGEKMGEDGRREENENRLFFSDFHET